MVSINTETKTGADCTGNSGDSNRVLTLSNTGLTSQGGLSVYVSGLELALTAEYTVTHNNIGTTIIFLNALFDDMNIIINYYQQAISTNVYGDMRNDFQGIIEENGQELTLIRQTETKGSMGEVTVVNETSYNIWTWIQDITRKDRQIHEMGLAILGNSKAFFYHSYPDSITGNGIVEVEAGDILVDADSRRWKIETILSEHTADAKEIFRTGVIHNIDLDQ